MNKQFESEPLRAADVKPPVAKKHSESNQLPTRQTPRLKTPPHDAESVAFVPRYSDSNDWYEP